MRSARLAVLAIVLTALVAGAGLYYSLVYAYYEVLAGDDLPEISLISATTGEAEDIAVSDVQAIDSDSSPIRLRACFETPTPLDELAATYEVYENAVPLNAPGWFSCFDAKQLGAELEDGEAVAFLGTPNINYGIDRIVAITPAGNGYVWNQINACGDAKFNGDPLPEGCPTPPEGMN